jgi:hypothetical protein
MNELTILIDFLLGITGLGLLAIAFLKTNSAPAFSPTFYYYCAIAPLLILWKIVTIALRPEASFDPTQPEQPLDRRSQTIALLQLLWLILPSMVFAGLEFSIGWALALIKYAITHSISMEDLYIICYLPAIVSILPLYSKRIYDLLPAGAIANIYGTYGDNAYNLLGVGLNTLVLLMGGTVGRWICGNYC